MTDFAASISEEFQWPRKRPVPQTCTAPAQPFYEREGTTARIELPQIGSPLFQFCIVTLVRILRHPLHSGCNRMTPNQTTGDNAACYGEAVPYDGVLCVSISQSIASYLAGFQPESSNEVLPDHSLHSLREAWRTGPISLPLDIYGDHISTAWFLVPRTGLSTFTKACVSAHSSECWEGFWNVTLEFPVDDNLARQRSQ